MNDNGLMTALLFKDTDGNKYAAPAGLWLVELILSLPEDWRDELCTRVSNKWEKMQADATKPKLYIVKG